MVTKITSVETIFYKKYKILSLTMCTHKFLTLKVLNFAEYVN